MWCLLECVSQLVRFRPCLCLDIITGISHLSWTTVLPLYTLWWAAFRLGSTSLFTASRSSSCAVHTLPHQVGITSLLGIIRRNKTSHAPGHCDDTSSPSPSTQCFKSTAKSQAGRTYRPRVNSSDICDEHPNLQRVLPHSELYQCLIQNRDSLQTEGYDAGTFFMSTLIRFSNPSWLSLRQSSSRLCRQSFLRCPISPHYQHTGSPVLRRLVADNCGTMGAPTFTFADFLVIRNHLLQGFFVGPLTSSVEVLLHVLVFHPID
jgi:hypothetical protein